MARIRRKLLTCKSLAHVLEPLTGPETDISVLEIALHLNPQQLRNHLMEEVARVEAADTHILFGYGLCGRALEGVVSSKSTLVLPKVDDCVGALLGSRQRHKELLKERAGCYFLEQHWLETELNVFVQMTKGLEHIPPDRRERIVQMTLKSYNTLALLDSGNTPPEADTQCMVYASRHELDFIRLKTELGLLNRLLSGPWTDEEFIVCEPGKPIPFF
jgi:hypothetical protein